MENGTQIFNLSSLCPKELWGDVRDQVMIIKQGDNIVILKKEDIKLLENKMNAKFLGI